MSDSARSADPAATRHVARTIGAVRLAVAVVVVAVLLQTYDTTGDGRPLDYFGYFSNQTDLGTASLLAHCAGLLVALVAAGAAVWAGSRLRGPLATPLGGSRP